MIEGRYRTARVAILTIIEEEFTAMREALGDGVQEIETSGYYSPDPATCDVVLGMSADRSNVPAYETARDMLELFMWSSPTPCTTSRSARSRREGTCFATSLTTPRAWACSTDTLEHWPGTSTSSPPWATRLLDRSLPQTTPGRRGSTSAR
jgi:hypothetical protein